MSAPSALLDPALHAIAGVEPVSVQRPGTGDEAAEILRGAARDGLAVVPWGGGVSLARGRAPARYDLALDLTALDHVIEYRPEDLTLTVECGVTLGRLREPPARAGCASVRRATASWAPTSPSRTARSPAAAGAW